MKTILIVDDDAVTRGLLSRVLNPHAKEFEVLTAKNGEEAANMIKDRIVNPVITDLQMPVVDGFQLLAHMSKNHPEIPVFVMTGFGNPDVDAKIKAIGPAKYFKKPLNMDVLTDSIFEELNTGAEGELRGITLPSFLQLIEMEKKTCTIEVIAEEKTGELYFQKGELFSAQMDDLINEKAAYELLCWNNPEIKIEPVNKKTRKEIHQPLMNILMEGLKLKDEKDSKKNVSKKPLKPLKNLKLKPKAKIR